jgi:hypothetical protein
MKSTTTLNVKEVNYQGVNMIACQTADEIILVGIKSICDGLGVDYSSQLKRISRDDVLPQGVVKMTIPTKGGVQEANMLIITFLPFFLTGIKSSMVRKELRDKIVDFKLKAKDVLAAAFLPEQPKSLNNISALKAVVEELESHNSRITTLETNFTRHDEIIEQEKALNHNARLDQKVLFKTTRELKEKLKDKESPVFKFKKLTFADEETKPTQAVEPVKATPTMQHTYYMPWQTRAWLAWNHLRNNQKLFGLDRWDIEVYERYTYPNDGFTLSCVRDNAKKYELLPDGEKAESKNRFARAAYEFMKFYNGLKTSVCA